MKSTYEELLTEACNISTDVCKKYADRANAKGADNAAEFFGLVGSLTFQTCITTLAVELFKPGSEDGKVWISRMYHEALRDALERWVQPDLRVFDKKFN